MKQVSRRYQISASCWFIFYLILRLWEWRWRFPPKRRLILKVRYTPECRPLHNHHCETRKSYFDVVTQRIGAAGTVGCYAVVWWKWTQVSEKYIAYIFRIGQQQAELLHAGFLLGFLVNPEIGSKKPTWSRYQEEIAFLVNPSILKMEATCFSEALVDFQRTTMRCIFEDGTLLYIHLFAVCLVQSLWWSWMKNWKEIWKERSWPIVRISRHLSGLDFDRASKCWNPPTRLPEATSSSPRWQLQIPYMIRIVKRALHSTTPMNLIYEETTLFIAILKGLYY